MHLKGDSDMRKSTIIIICLIFLAGISFTGNRSGSAEQVSATHDDAEVIVLRSLVIKDGRLSFLTDTGGCTSKHSFKIDIETVKENTKNVNIYILIIRKIVPDRCKAFLPEGVVIEFDLKKDLGIKENSAVSVKNMVNSR
jgi:hypothetical protein